MKKYIQQPISKLLASSFAVACLAASAVHADTTNVFNFQQGNLTKDGGSYGTGSGYSGMVDGSINDANPAAVFTATTAIGFGNQFVSTSPAYNGQQFIGLFAYDLTELKNFIAANTTSSSTAQVVSVSLQLTCNGGSGSGPVSYLDQTEPFTSGANWTNNGTGAWSSPWQSGLTEAKYGWTGGGSPLTANIAGSAPYISSALYTAGNLLIWSNSATFVSVLTNALARTDHTLYLMADPSYAGNSDGRVFFHKSSDTTPSTRPQLQITVTVIGAPPVSSDLTWKGNVDGNWNTTTANWNDGASAVAYADGKNVTFDDSLSTSPLNNIITLANTYSPSNVLVSNSTYDYSLSGGGLTGSMNLTKQGGATFSLGMSNSYTGLTTVSAGTLLISDAHALGSVLSNVVVASGASLALSNGITLSGKPITINGTGSANNGALRTADAVNPVTVASPITVGSNGARIQTGIANGQLILTGPITDNGSNYLLNLNAGQGSSILQVNTAGNTTISNVTLYSYLPPPSGGSIIFGVNNAFPSALANFGGGLFDLNGTSQTFTGLGQGFLPKTGVIINNSATISTLTVNVPAGTTVSAQTPIEGNLNLVINGPGSQTLAGGVTHSYTGTTLINGASVSLASVMSSVTGDVTVTNGGTLHGYSTIGGSVTINTNCIFYPGYSSNQVVSPYGLNTLADLTLKPGSTTIACINPDLSPSNNVINVGGTLTYGGTLVVYSIGHTNALKAGETFTIFPTATSRVGNFDNVVFNSIESQPGTTVSFDPATGTVTVNATTAPTLSVTPQGGNVMQINWDSSFYKLQMQTNSLATGLSNNWVDFASANGLMTTNVINDPTIPATFFRLAPKP